MNDGIIPIHRILQVVKSALVSVPFLVAMSLVGCQNEYNNSFHAQAESPPPQQQANADSAIILKPGDNLQAAVDKAPAGAKFVLRPGLYRLQQVQPKDGQQFVGQPGAIVNGAAIVRNWRFDEADRLWAAGNLPDPLRPSGRCGKGVTECRHREDLFVGGKRQVRVGSKAALGPGKWYFEDHTAYLAADPGDALVELSVLPVGFYGNGRNVVLRNFTVEKYATAAQKGAIDARSGADWQVIDMTVRWNRGLGLYMSQGMKVLRGAVVHNGQLGIGGENDFGLVDGVEIAYNNYAGFSSAWEAGGSKFVDSDGLVVRNNCVHDNEGPGLWTDIDNINILYEGNKVFRNANGGIKHEISYKAVIRNNFVAENGYGKDNWLWGSQILVQNSSNVDVYGNTVYVAPDYGNGIGVIHQDRGEGAYGPHIAYNNSIHDNTVVFLGRKGVTGLVSDHDEATFWRESNNIFRSNRYFGVQPDRPFFALEESVRRWSDVNERGQEQGGAVRSEKKPLRKLSCG